jgi:hypothetical protein
MDLPSTTGRVVFRVWSTNAVGTTVFAPPHTAITRWTTTLPSKVNLPHAINLSAVCGANDGPTFCRERPLWFWSHVTPGSVLP